MKQFFVLCLGLCSSLTFSQTLPKVLKETSFSIGKSLTVHSEVLGEERTLNIYLPQSYTAENQKTYPVIYLLDGSSDEDFIHIAGLVQFCSFSWINILPESIVVGIANVDRRRDFTFPTNNEKDKRDYPTTGHSAEFIHFIQQEIKPLIDANFRTTSPNTLIGQSLGGLLAAEIVLTKPEMFDNYIIVSPSLWWDDESLLEKEPEVHYSNKKVYIASGKEGEIMERTSKDLYEKLAREYKESVELYFGFLEDKSHGDALHLAVYHAFGKIFNKKE